MSQKGEYGPKELWRAFFSNHWRFTPTYTIQKASNWVGIWGITLATHDSYTCEGQKLKLCFLYEVRQGRTWKFIGWRPETGLTAWESMKRKALLLEVYLVLGWLWKQIYFSAPLQILFPNPTHMQCWPRIRPAGTQRSSSWHSRLFYSFFLLEDNTWISYFPR